MTYIESIKSGHIAIWNQDESPLSLHEGSLVENKTCTTLIDRLIQSDIYAVNAINQMIDSARDL